VQQEWDLLFVISRQYGHGSKTDFKFEIYIITKPSGYMAWGFLYFVRKTVYG
jgi:hypothetical protein